MKIGAATVILFLLLFAIVAGWYVPDSGPSLGDLSLWNMTEPGTDVSAYPERVLFPLLYAHHKLIRLCIEPVVQHRLSLWWAGRISVLFAVVALALLYRIAKQRTEAIPALVILVLTAINPIFLGGIMQGMPYAASTVLVVLFMDYLAGFHLRGAGFFRMIVVAIAFLLISPTAWLFLPMLFVALIFGSPKLRSFSYLFALGVLLVVQAALILLAGALLGFGAVFRSLFYYNPWAALTTETTWVPMAALIILATVGWMLRKKIRRRSHEEFAISSTGNLYFVLSILLLIAAASVSLFQIGYPMNAMSIAVPVVTLVLIEGLYQRGRMVTLVSAMALAVVMAALILQQRHQIDTDWRKLLNRDFAHSVMVFPSDDIVTRAFFAVEERPLVRRNGFYIDGAYHNQGTIDGFQYCGIRRLAVSNPGAMLHPCLGAVIDHRAYALIDTTESDGHAAYRFLESHYAKLDQAGRRKKQAMFYFGDRDKFAKALTTAQITELEIPLHPDPRLDETTRAEDFLLQRIDRARNAMDYRINCSRGCIPWLDTGEMEQAQYLCGTSARYTDAVLQTGASFGSITQKGKWEKLQYTVLSCLRKGGAAYRPDTRITNLEAAVHDQGPMIRYLNAAADHARNQKPYVVLTENLLASLLRASKPTQHGLHMPWPTFLPDGGRGPDPELVPAHKPFQRDIALLEPLAFYLRDHPDSENGTKLFNGLRDYLLRDSGFIQGEGSLVGKTEYLVRALHGLAIRARQTNDSAIAHRVKRSVDWLLEHSSRSGKVASRFPIQGKSALTESPGATITLISTMLLLADDNPDYWDAIDRFVRNGLTDWQFPKSNRYAGLFADMPSTFHNPKPPHPSLETTADAIMVMSQLHRRIVERQFDGGPLVVNLLVDHRAGEADINTTVQGETRLVTIITKSSGDLLVRLPKFVQAESLKSEGGIFDPASHTLRFLHLRSGDRVNLKYVLPQTVETFADDEYQWRGNRLETVSGQEIPSP